MFLANPNSSISWPIQLKRKSLQDQRVREEKDIRSLKI